MEKGKLPIILIIGLLLFILFIPAVSSVYTQGNFWSRIDDTLVTTIEGNHVNIGENKTTDYMLYVNGSTLFNNTVYVPIDILLRFGSPLSDNAYIYSPTANNLNFTAETLDFYAESTNFYGDFSINDGSLVIKEGVNKSGIDLINDVLDFSSATVYNFDNDVEMTKLNLTNDSNQIVLDSDGGNPTTLNDGDPISPVVVTFPSSTCTLGGLDLNNYWSGSNYFTGNYVYNAYRDVHYGDTNTYRQFDSDEIKFVAGGTNMLRMRKLLTFPTVMEVVINDGSASVDFRVESNGDTHLIFARGSANTVGISTNKPRALLDVGGGTRNYIDGIDDLLVKDDVEVDGSLYVRDVTNSTGGFATDTGTGWSGTYTVTEGTVTVRNGIIIGVSW